MSNASKLMEVDFADARDSADWDERGIVADEGVYRLGLLAVPTLGLPPALTVGEADCEWLMGPVVTQVTRIRQRPGVPAVFDKTMSRFSVGEGEFLLVISIRAKVSALAEIEALLPGWRATAESTAGLLATVLDERVGHQELFEDVVLLRDGVFVGAGDSKTQIRTFVPAEVSALDVPALEALSGHGNENPRASRAARLLRRAVLEGPTADAFVLLFVAAESVLDSRQPSKREFDALLESAGLNPDGLPVHTGRLIGLRGRIVHEGLEEDPNLRVAFYEMEAIVRLLIRRSMGLAGGWCAAPGINAYAEEWTEVLDAASEPRKTVWHDKELPPAGPPDDFRIPRRVFGEDAGLLVRVDESLTTGASGDTVDLVTSVVADARCWFEPDGPPLALLLGVPPGTPPSSSIVSNAAELWIRPDRLEGALDQPNVLVNLVWDLVGAIGSIAVMRGGLDSSGDGVAIVEAVGAQAQYERLVTFGTFDASVIDMSGDLDDLMVAGAIAGWAAAGDARASSVLATATGRGAELGRAIVDGLMESPLLPQRPSIHVTVKPDAPA